MAVARLPGLLLLIGLLEGAGWLAAYGLSWKLFGQVLGGRPMSAAAVWLLDVVGLGGAAMVALGSLPDWLSSTQTPASPDRSRRVLSTGGVLGLAVSVGLLYVLLNSLPVGYQWYPNDWRRVFRFAFPQPIFRVLLLAPLWRRWGMVLAAGLGRMHPATHPTLARLSSVVSPWRVMGTWLIPATLTSIWCSSDKNTLLGLALSLAVLGLAYSMSVWLSRRSGGQSGRSMLAMGQTTLLVFLAGYLVCARVLEHTW